MIVTEDFVGVHPPELARDCPELMASIQSNQQGLLEVGKQLEMSNGKR